MLVEGASAYYIAGDPIGPDSSTTDSTGGFTAVMQDGVNLGQPAILASLTGQELLTELRVIVFGVPAADGSLYFDAFDYHLDVWTSRDYFDNKDPQFRVALGAPLGVQLVPDGATSIVPDTPFGTAGVAGDNATTYDFRFDLTQVSLFKAPLPQDDWVIAFQSWHNTTQSGWLRVAGSGASEGPLPLFSREGVIPRGILGGQDPDKIALRWGMALAAVPEVSPCNLAADFNADEVVDAADYTLWRDGLGAGHTEPEYELWKSNFGEILPESLAGDFNGDGAINAADYTVWRDNLGAADETCLCRAGNGLDGVDEADYRLWLTSFGGGSRATHGSSDSVPEPASLLLVVGASLVLRRRRG